MGKLFAFVLNMSLTASYVILFVIFTRLLLKRAPKFISYALWIVVAFRLIIPFTFESIFSLLPPNSNTLPISPSIIYKQSSQINSGIEIVDSLVNNSFSAQIYEASVNPLQSFMQLGAYIWAAGIIALFVYSIVSILILKSQLNNSQFIKENIYQAKNLKTPFVLGFIRPKIYLPAGLNLEESNYILLHEQTHIKRKDHIIKVLAFIILSIHWFNPLVWVAFVLMSKDMELSCDERVLKQMSENIKKSYAKSLLSLATARHILNGNPLAFGEGNVKNRIKNVLNYKRPKVWIVVASVIIISVVCVGLLTNPVKNSDIMVNDTPNPASNPDPNTISSDDEQEENKPEVITSRPKKISGINKIDQDNIEDSNKNRNQPITNDIAEYISYDYVNRSIYIAGLRIFDEFGTEEFGYSNEGSCSIIENENALIFSITTATGSITGTLDGPTVYFKMDLDTNKIIEKEFGPAPNYDELGMTEFKQYSGMTIELSDERMAEIGVYFKEYILKIEAGGFLPGEMN